MRLLLLLLLAVAPAWSQSVARPLPPGTVPLEEPPAAPRAQSEPALEVEVRTRSVAGGTVTEYRVGGKLYRMRVTPAHGRPYDLIDHRGDGQFARHDGLDPGVRVPQWVLLEF